MIRAVVAGAFDDLRSQDIRFLQEAARSGRVAVLLWSDLLAERLTGKRPGFQQPERKYFLEAIRFVERVQIVNDCPGKDALPAELPAMERDGLTWIVPERENSSDKEQFCKSNRIGYRVVPCSELQGFPAPEGQAACPHPAAGISSEGKAVCPHPAAGNSSEGKAACPDAAASISSEGNTACPHPATDNLHTSPPPLSNSTRKKVVVTGCYDWLHSGHVRFFEEVSAFGDLYVVVGHDANITLLKGPGHPLQSQEERRYVVGSVRHVKQALISTGHGWLDAEPEIDRLKPDIYAVNEDGDQGGKREFCQKHGIEYLVLQRRPAAGLPKRTSTDLRGF